MVLTTFQIFRVFSTVGQLNTKTSQKVWLLLKKLCFALILNF